MMPVGLKQALKDELPEIPHATRFNPGYGNVLRYEDKLFAESVAYVDKDFFAMFSFRLIAGNSEKLFLTKEEVVLTPGIVRKYFGDQDPIGKTILIGNNEPKPFTVTGIIEDPPANSSRVGGRVDDGKFLRNKGVAEKPCRHIMTRMIPWP